ncbi:MAG: hypothetical protein AAF488_08865 [Planctomycetota bacterium]
MSSQGVGTLTVDLPPTVVALLGLSLFAGAVFFSIAFSGQRRWFTRLLLAVLACAVIAPGAYLYIALKHPGLLDPRIRTYRAFYQDIAVGMTRDEVLATLGYHYPAGGERTPPRRMGDEPDELSFLMDAEGTNSPNAEGIRVNFQDGRVRSKVYSPD